MKGMIFLFFAILSHLFAEPLPQKVLICGVCKNVAKRLPLSLNIMEKIGSLFSDYQIIVYENNSIDSTVDILKQWQNENSRVNFLSENLNQIFINRKENNVSYLSEIIGRARNKVLELVKAPKYDPYEYLIWMDMDFILEPNYSGIIEVFESKQPWDAVFAYGIDPSQEYWDWYAFRDQRCPLGPESLGNAWWYELERKLLLQPSDSWYPVYSAFGGCGIYRRAAIEGCSYSGIVTHELAEWVHATLSNPTYVSHPIIQRYWNDTSNLKKIVQISQPHLDLPEIKDEEVGILLAEDPYQNIWRMSCFGYRYPSVCEHIIFHAAMINHGYDKLFINPRLVFYY